MQYISKIDTDNNSVKYPNIYENMYVINSGFFIYDFYLLKLFIETFQILYSYYISISKLKLTIMYIKNFINTPITEIILG